MTFKVKGIATTEAQLLQTGGLDANQQPAQVHIADAGANPCRHCLGLIVEGDEMLILGYRPFDGVQPYAETGPIFLHKNSCEHYDSDQLPDWFEFLDPAVIRGYTNKDWIVYETGAVVAGSELSATCHAILSDPAVAYIHIRSKFNCFQCRVERA